MKDDNTLTISSSLGITNPSTAGDYYFGFSLQEGGTLKRKQSLIMTITAADLSSLTVSPFTADQDRITMYSLSFTAPESIASGSWKSDSSNAQTTFIVEFQTQDSSNNAQFAIDLGMNTTDDLSRIPCYGGDSLSSVSGTSSLYCIIRKASTASTTTPAIIQVNDFLSK